MKKNGLYFVPLGGSNEIGMNLNMFGIVKDGREEWIIVDAGVSIGKDYGVRIVMPSLDFAKNKNILGIICTHGHDDHIGAIPYVLPMLGNNIPVYATKFTMYLIKAKIAEYESEQNIRENSNFKNLKTVEMGARFSLGGFNIELDYVTHSILEPNMITIRTEYGNFLHTGDWKFDDQPVLGQITDYNLFASKKNIDYLVCDSTNSLEPEATLPEGVARDNLEIVINKYKNRRIFVSCFASNMARMKGIIDIALKFGKKIALMGRSIWRMYHAAIECGYLKEHPSIIQPDKAGKIYPKENLLVICTGSQGEPGAVLQKLAFEKYKYLKIEKNDVVVFSSRVIPGNEIEISNIKNELILRGVTIIDSKKYTVHVSGHPSQPEIRKLIDLVKPKFIIPVHGDPIHLYGVKEIAEEKNYKVIVPCNGAILKLDTLQGNVPRIIDNFEAKKVCKDGKRILSTDLTMFQTRKSLSESGCIFISLTIKGERIKKLWKFYHSSLGALPKSEVSKKYLSKIEHICQKVVESAEHGQDRNKMSGEIFYLVSQFLFQEYGKKPFVIVHIF